MSKETKTVTVATCDLCESKILYLTDSTEMTVYCHSGDQGNRPKEVHICERCKADLLKEWDVEYSR